MKRLIITALIALTIIPVFANSSSKKYTYDGNSYKGPVKSVNNYWPLFGEQVYDWLKKGKKIKNLDYIENTDGVVFDKQGRIIEHWGCCAPDDYGYYNYDKQNRLVSIALDKEDDENSSNFTGWKYTYYPNNFVKTATYYTCGDVEETKNYDMQICGDSIIYIEDERRITVYYPKQKLNRPCSPMGETNDEVVQNPYNWAYRSYYVNFESPKIFHDSKGEEYPVQVMMIEIGDTSVYEHYNGNMYINIRRVYGEKEICTYYADGENAGKIYSREILNKYGDVVKELLYTENGVKETRFEYTYDRYGNWTSRLEVAISSTVDNDNYGPLVHIRQFRYYY